MSNHNNQFLSIPSSTPKVQRSTSFGGGRLHFDYSRKTADLQPATSMSRSSQFSTKPSTLQRQSTVDFPVQQSVSTLPEVNSRPRISYEQFNPKNMSDRENVSSLKEPQDTSRYTPSFYEQSTTLQVSHPTEDVPLATSRQSVVMNKRNVFPTSSPRTDVPVDSRSSSYPYRPYSNYSQPVPPPNISPSSKVQPIMTSSYEPLSTRPPSVPDKTIVRTGPEHLRPHESIAPPSTQLQSSNSLSRSSVLSTSSSKPLSLSSQLTFDQPSRPLTIGYTLQQQQEIEKAQQILVENVKRQEAEARIRLEAQMKAEKEAKLETLKKAEEEAEARRLEEEEKARKLLLVDDDEDVERFMKRLDTQIKESRDSKNWEGALVGRQNNQSSVQTAESLTNALKKETVEGHDADNQASTKSVADSSEEYTFLERIKNMKTHHYFNRKKFAEHYYDFDDDDSELNSLNSINSFLSTVTEEELLDSLSLNNVQTLIDSETNNLQPRVISYIHDLVDDIFSSIKKSDVVVTDTLQAEKSHSDDFYVSNDAIQRISEDAKQFFTPRNSAEADSEELVNNEKDPLCEK